MGRQSTAALVQRVSMRQDGGSKTSSDNGCFGSNTRMYVCIVLFTINLAGAERIPSDAVSELRILNFV